jgi:hypothetical protein
MSDEKREYLNSHEDEYAHTILQFAREQVAPLPRDLEERGVGADKMFVFFKEILQYGIPINDILTSVDISLLIENRDRYNQLARQLYLVEFQDGHLELFRYFRSQPNRRDIIVNYHDTLYSSIPLDAENHTRVISISSIKTIVSYQDAFHNFHFDRYLRLIGHGYPTLDHNLFADLLKKYGSPHFKGSKRRSRRKRSHRRRSSHRRH